MAALDDLIAQIEDETLRERIRVEVKRANKQKKFGLVFEQHLPEATPLYDVPVKKGSIVALKGQSIKDILFVESISNNEAVCVQKSTKEKITLPVKDLVTVAQFGEPIYPYLKPIDSVCNAPDSDLWHTLIEADNYHALQLLEYLYAGKVDCIYIDPPYNTGARDWKYNNDYVDGADSYRHSKWLSFMEKRLKLAKRLLNPSDSALIVTIDEKEYLHLGCLLEELFPNSRIQMVSIVIQAAGQNRKGELGRVEEYAFFIYNGSFMPCLSTDDLLNEAPSTKPEKIRWESLLRGGTNSNRRDRPNLFYPVFIDKNTGAIAGCGESKTLKSALTDWDVPEGSEAIWPYKTGNVQGSWRVMPDTLMELVRGGWAKAGKITAEGKGTVWYAGNAVRDRVKSGEFVVTGKDEQGANIIEIVSVSEKKYPVKTVWNRPRHHAGWYGTNLLSGILHERKFPFPKSLYAVEDALRIGVASKPNALIIDFFAGSGTTLHAVNLLNAEDGGHRRCILVTNNEVSSEETKDLYAKGYLPGDPEWEELGIARYVTWPRTVCSIMGVDIKGQSLTGNYLCGDQNNPLAMSKGFTANVAFFKLGFLDKTSVALGRQFSKLLPVLWMKAGAHGPCPALETDKPPKILILPENQFAVLTEDALYEEFAQKVNADGKIRTVFIVTDSEPGYREMVAGLKVKNTYQLFRDYLDNFRINHSRR